MDTLRQIFESHQGPLINKWDNYIEVYQRYFEKYRGTRFVFLEIGIAHGGSLQMWRKFFGEEAVIIGVDVNPECKRFEDGNIKVFIGSQEDPVFLEDLKTKIPRVDVLLDDGGHTMRQQMVTFEHLFDHVKEEGLYVCEDLHTSYWPAYGGGYKKPGSFIEFGKRIVDYLHGWHAPKGAKRKMFTALTEKIFSIHFFDSILIIEKRRRSAPVNLRQGTETLSYHFVDYGQKKSLF